MSLVTKVDRKLQELAYLSLTGLDVTGHESVTQHTFEALLTSLQLDNQLLGICTRHIRLSLNL